jgi:hypothetical protein
MPGLDLSIVEHRLPIKSGFKPYKQPPRKIYKDEVLADVKKEVERLLDANFVRHADTRSGFLTLSLFIRRMEK